MVRASVIYFEAFVPNWGSVPDWIAAVGAVLAFAAAAVAICITRQISKNADLKQIHDFLMSTDVQRGRRLMHECFDKKADWGGLKNDDHDLVNNALSGYQRLAQYYEFRWVPRGRARKLWKGRIVSDWKQIESFIVWRRNDTGRAMMWDNLVEFARTLGAKVTI